MGIESNHYRLSIILPGQSLNPFQQTLMTPMNSVERAYRDDRIAKRRKGFKVPEYVHYEQK
jgi:hypothetical protein